ncbi:MAG TPA: tetratricopeptide repeat protein [Gemmatimonadaceae bacterium]|nr:tetratricopeptide repeat protein [Gemmatimonadaceae bacterium]
MSSRRCVTRYLLLSSVVASVGCASGAPPRGVREPVPLRPALSASADTNDPQAYFDVGLRALEKDLGRAADAFFWASRLDPGSADALYARRVALHAYNLERVRGYLTSNDLGPSSAFVREIDSLLYIALERNPFLYAQFDQQLIELANNKVSRNGFFRPLFYIGSLQYAAWKSYSEGNFAKAVAQYAEAMKRDTSDYGLHGQRARAFYLMSQYDSALAEMTRMLDRARAVEARKITPVYQSKGTTEYAIAMIHLARGDGQAARSALQRALSEDFSLYMAHAVLADVSISLGDTAAGLSEYELAVQLHGTDPALRYRYGSALLNAKELDAAETQFRRAIEINPDYASPYLPLAYVLERKGLPNEAAEHYAKYVAKAPKVLTAQITVAKERLAELRAQ